MIMLKLIEAKRFGDRNTINIEDLRQKSSKEWFLGRKGEERNWTTARGFTQASDKCGSQRD